MLAQGSFKPFVRLSRNVLQFALCISSARGQYQAVQGPGGLVNQRPLEQARPASSWDTPKTYARIRLVTRDDIEKIYPLVIAYVQNPDLAYSVADMVVDQNSWPDRNTCLFPGQDPLEALNEPPVPIDEKGHEALEAYVKSMGLEPQTIQWMLDALSWKRQHLNGSKPDSPKGFATHNREYGDAATAIITSLCKNITTLYVHGVGRDSFEELLLKSNYGLLPTPALQNLRNVEIIPDGHSLWSDSYDQFEFLDYFRYFHRLPNIKSISMEGVMQYQNERGLFPPGTGNIKRIHIGHSDITSGLLGTIIRIPKALEEISVSLGGLYPTDGGFPQVFPKTLGKCLLDHKDSLRTIDLDLDLALLEHEPRSTREKGEIEDRKYSEYEDDEEEDEMFSEKDKFFRLDEAVSKGPLSSEDLPNTRRYGHTLGSLHDFNSLTHLTLSVKLMFGRKLATAETPARLATEPPYRLIDALPPNLQYFCLRGYRKGDNADVDDHVAELVAKKNERLLYLKEIRGIDEYVPSIEERYPEDMSQEDVWEQPEIELDWIEV